MRTARTQRLGDATKEFLDMVSRKNAGESIEEMESRKREALKMALRTGSLTKTHRYTREQVNAMCAKYDLDPEHDFVLAEGIKFAQDGIEGLDVMRDGAGFTTTPWESKLQEKGCPQTGKTLRRLIRYQLNPAFRLK